MKTLSVQAVFDRMDKWRNFPAYALERRSDIFFSFFLARLLDAEFGIGSESAVIPEFPLKKDANNQSRKVDFFVISEDRQQSFLVELKTDRNSLSEPQLNYLQEASRSRLCTLTADVKRIAQNADTDKRRKYLHLLNHLAELNLIELDKKLRLDSFDPPFRIRQYMESTTRVEPIDLRPKVVCLVPEIPCVASQYPDFEWMSFEVLANCIKKEGSIGRRFAKSLRLWASHEAGHIDDKPSD
ncbi:MAG: hypothetical protein F4X44_10275 [Gammaproteobacteria bacterium]|nr:hypothetical protein [Gammaproteobacteria bacterium]MYD80984.1 hypothetical protein [Gammaproteobacteria bacterium]